MGMIKLASAVTLAIYFVIAEAAAEGPGVCSGICTGNKTTFEECTAANPNTTCAKSPFGSSTHCFVAVGKYKTQIKTGIETGIGYISGCIDCTDKTKACSKVKEILEQKLTVNATSCEIECCTTAMCNKDLLPTLPPTGIPTTGIPAGEGVPNNCSPVVLVAALVAVVWFGI